MTGDGQVRSQWNESLLSDVIAPLYCDMLHTARTIIGPGPRYNDLWPVVENAPWNLVTKSLYENASDTQLFHSQQDGGCWVTLNESVVISSTNNNHDEALAQVLLNENLKVVVMKSEVSERSERALTKTRAATKLTKILSLTRSAQVVNMLKIHNNKNHNEATPSFVRSHFKRTEIAHPCLKNPSDVVFLLKYAFSDLQPDNYNEVVGLPFLPLANGEFSKFEAHDDFEVNKFIGNAAEHDLFNLASSELLNLRIDDEVDLLMKSKALVGAVNLKKLEFTDGVNLLAFVLPRTWKKLAEIRYQDDKSVTDSWLQKFWTYCLVDSSSNVNLLENTYPLLPCFNDADSKHRVLVNLKKNSSVIFPPTNSNSNSNIQKIQKVLQTIGVRVVDTTTMTTPNARSALLENEFVNPLTLTGVITAISNLPLTPKALQNRFKSIENNDRIAFRLFLSDPENNKNTGEDTDFDDVVMVLKTLPIFPTFGVEADGSSNFTSLDGADEVFIPPSAAMSAKLLSKQFLKLTSRNDLLLLKKVGIFPMEISDFYSRFGLTQLTARGAATTTTNIKETLQLLEDYSAYLEKTTGTTSPDSFTKLLQTTKFIPNNKNDFFTPSDLYDRHAPNLMELLSDEK